MIGTRKILITCGVGGVGKTTLSAALGLASALEGKKTIVITMDPAKRLAQSLGLKDLGDDPTDLTPLLKKNFSTHPIGSLHALMPNTRLTFEAFLLELTHNPTLARALIKNPIFQIFTQEFSGTNEYMAIEKLFSIYSLNTYDCIILDTPPSRNTLAFLNAPELLSRFFDEKVIRYLVLPTHKILSIGVKKTLAILENLTGSGFMTHLFDFASGLFEIRVAFQANLKKITALLESEQTGFWLVTTPNTELTSEMNHFVQLLQEHKLNFEGIALNRSLSYLKEITTTEGADQNTMAALEIIRLLKEREKKIVSEIELSLRPKKLFKLPELVRDVHSLEDLYHVAMALKH